MGTINPTLPTLTNPNSSEDPLIRQALSTIIAEFNGNIDNNNIKSAAAIAYSKLATMNTGQVLLGNAGVPTATTLSGDVTVSALGVTAIGAGKVTGAMNADSSITSAKVVDGTLVAADLSASAAIADTQLASPNNAVYRELLTATGAAANGSGGSANNPYILGSTDGSTGMYGCGAISTQTVGNTVAPRWFYNSLFQPVAGKTLSFLVVAQCMVGNTAAPAITFTVGLYPITATSGGGAGTIAYSAGSVIANSTCAFASPAVGAMTNVVSTGFNASALTNNTHYVLGVAFSSTPAANSITQLSAQLLMRHT